MGTGGAVGRSASGFGFSYAVSGGYGGYGMGNYGFNGWGQGSPNGGYYNPMMMNQAAMMNQGAMMGNGFPANMNMGQNGMMNNAGVGISGNARSNPMAGAGPERREWEHEREPECQRQHPAGDLGQVEGHQEPHQDDQESLRIPQSSDQR